MTAARWWLGCLVFAAGCSSSAFDDRQAEAWSDSNGAEGVSAADYGAAVAGITTDRPGAMIAGLGVDPIGLSQIRYDETGVLDQSGADLSALATVSLSARPTLVAAPEPVPGANGLVALGGLGALDRIVFYDVSSGTPAEVGSVSGADCGAPGENLGHAMVLGFTSAGVDNVLDLIALRGNELFLFPDLDPSADSPTCLRCPLTSSGSAAATSVALIDIGLSANDEIIIGLQGALTVFDAFQIEEASAQDAGCFEIRTPQIGNLTSPGNEPDFGAQLAVGDADDDGFADLAATAPSADRVYLVPNLTDSGNGGLLQALPAPADSGGFGRGPVAMLDLDGDEGDELVVGDPLASPDGVAGAGQAAVYKFSDDGEYELRGVLFDSTPEVDQRFGRALSTAEFVFEDDTDLLVVGAAGEVFTYFRAFASSVDPRR